MLETNRTQPKEDAHGEAVLLKRFAEFAKQDGLQEQLIENISSFTDLDDNLLKELFLNNTNL